MAVSYNLADALQKYESKIINNKQKAVKQTAMDYYRFSNKTGVVPIKTGALRRSAMINSDFDAGIVRWSTPYARRRKIEGSLTGVAHYDLVTWYHYKNVLTQNFKNYLIGGK